MKIYCPNCALHISTDEETIGSKGQCPKCGYKFVISQYHRHPPHAEDLGTAPTIRIAREEEFDLDHGRGRERWVGSKSFVATMGGGLAISITVLIIFWMSRHEATPPWARFPAGAHHASSYGALALLFTAMWMELLGRIRRIEHLHSALPFILGMTAMILLGANFLAATAVGGFSGHTGMALAALSMVAAALALSLHLEERPEVERSALLVLIALGMGAVFVLAHLGIPSGR